MVSRPGESQTPSPKPQSPSPVALQFPKTMADPSSTPTASSSSSTQPPPATPAQQETCAQCSKSPSTLKQCLKCHSVAYCNKDCQKAHFKTHKKVCAGLAQEYVKNHEPKMASRAPARNDARDKGLQKWQVCCSFFILSRRCDGLIRGVV